MISRLKAALRRSEADKLAAALDAQRAEQRNAEALLRRLGETRERAAGGAPDDAAARLEQHDQAIAQATRRAAQALKSQAELMMRLGRTPTDTARARG